MGGREVRSPEEAMRSLPNPVWRSPLGVGPLLGPQLFFDCCLREMAKSKNLTTYSFGIDSRAYLCPLMNGGMTKLLVKGRAVLKRPASCVTLFLVLVLFITVLHR